MADKSAFYHVLLLTMQCPVRAAMQTGEVDDGNVEKCVRISLWGSCNV